MFNITWVSWISKLMPKLMDNLKFIFPKHSKMLAGQKLNDRMVSV